MKHGDDVMMRRILLAALLVWTPVTSAVCEAACVLADGARMAAPVAAEPACHHAEGSDAPPSHGGRHHGSLDCCCVVNTSSVVSAAVAVAGTGAVVPVGLPPDGPSAGAARRSRVRRTAAPPGVLNAAFLRGNPHLLI